MNRRNAISLLLGITAFHHSFADERYPVRAIKIIVPFAAGSIVDVHMRKIGPHLANLLGQPVFIDNRPGASGTLGVAVGAQAKPDGYTITVGTSSSLAVS